MPSLAAGLGKFLWILRDGGGVINRCSEGRRLHRNNTGRDRYCGHTGSPPIQADSLGAIGFRVGLRECRGRLVGSSESPTSRPAFSCLVARKTTVLYCRPILFLGGFIKLSFFVLPRLSSQNFAYLRAKRPRLWRGFIFCVNSDNYQNTVLHYTYTMYYVIQTKCL